MVASGGHVPLLPPLGSGTVLYVLTPEGRGGGGGDIRRVPVNQVLKGVS